MKRGTLEHPKLLALKRELDRPLPYVVGILEMLWHFTARYAPTGDLGRFTDDEIAAAVHWTAGGRRLVVALVAAGWLAPPEESPGSRRLLVHDWRDHADDVVKKALQRKGLEFACPVTDRSRPVNGGLPIPIPIPIPSQASPLPPQEEEKEPPPRAAALGSSGFAEFWSRYRVKQGKGAAMRAWQKLGCAGFAPKIMATLERMQRDDAQWAAGYQPHPATWLNRHGWDDEPAAAPRPHRAPTADERKLEAIRRSDELFDRLSGGGAHGPERGQADREQLEHAVSAGLVGGAHGSVRH